MRRDARQHEDASADDRSYTEARQLDGAEHAMQAVFAAQLCLQSFVSFYLKQLIGHTHLK
jgi:hypothetical protein